MATLASRQTLNSIDPLKLAEIVLHSGVVMHIVVDKSVDPAELVVTRTHEGIFPSRVLFSRTLDDGKIDVFELATILDQLGYNIDLEEL